MKANIKKFFTGVKVSKKENLLKTDFEIARIKYTDNNAYCYRQFDEKSNIEVDKIYYFCDLVRFFYQDYCCVVEANKLEKIDK